MEEAKTFEDNQITVDDEKDNQALESQESNLAENDEESEEAEREKLRREREARAQALTLEIVGDLPYAEVKPPENVLFVCKLNPVTEGWLLRTLLNIAWLKICRRGSSYDFQSLWIYTLLRSHSG